MFSEFKLSNKINIRTIWRFYNGIQLVEKVWVVKYSNILEIINNEKNFWMDKFFW